MNQVDFAAVVTHAYFYLIREREFAIRGEDVYKLGITKQVMGLKIPRFDGYKKGSELVMITECPMALLETIETSLKRLFCETFQRHDDGYEFFIGNRREMSNLIYKACDEAWTSDQQRIRAETLRSVLQLQGANNESGSITQTVPSAQQKKADKAAEEAEKAAKEAEKAAEDALRITQEETNFTRWFDERVSIKADAFVKQATWYTDYRLWAVSVDVVPLSEGAAIATFKRLYTSRGISVGSKTYGIELIHLGLTTVDVPLEACFLKSFLPSQKSEVQAYSGKELFDEFVTITKKNPSNTMKLSEKSFGSKIQKYGGVTRTRPSNTVYTIHKPSAYQYLLSKGYIEVIPTDGVV